MEHEEIKQTFESVLDGKIETMYQTALNELRERKEMNPEDYVDVWGRRGNIFGDIAIDIVTKVVEEASFGLTDELDMLDDYNDYYDEDYYYIERNVNEAVYDKLCESAEYQAIKDYNDSKYFELLNN